MSKQEEIHAEIKKILDPEKLKVYHDPDYGRPEHYKKINDDYKRMHEVIDGMELNLKKSVKKDKEKYMDEFEDYLRNLHVDYRALEHTNRELSSYTKLTADIEAKIKERAQLN